MAVALETKVLGQLSRGAAFWTLLTTKTALYPEVKALLPLIALHVSKSKAPLQVAASWTVPRPATHMGVLVGKGAARQRVTEHLVESCGMLASNTTKEMPLPLCRSQVCCRHQDTTKRKQARVIARALILRCGF